VESEIEFEFNLSTPNSNTLLIVSNTSLRIMHREIDNLRMHQILESIADPISVNNARLFQF
jgi:hypothetical protein